MGDGILNLSKPSVMILASGNTFVGEFVDEVWQEAMKKIYEMIYPLCSHIYDFLIFLLDDAIGAAQGELAKPVDQWNTSAFTLIENIVVTNVCIPIAAAFITFIFCMELIHLMQDGNQMHNIKPQNVIFIFLKFAVCALICSKSFEIVMGFHDIGRFAVEKLGSHTVGSLMDGKLDLNKLLPATPTEYTGTLVLTLVGDMFLLLIALIVVAIMSILIRVRVMLWFLEFLIYASAAPIPFSTFDNKEWAQVGLNYVKKMLSLSFEGFFMLLMIALYAYIVAGLSASSDFFTTLLMLLGTGVALVVLLQKAGTISASIFNAH